MLRSAPFPFPAFPFFQRWLSIPRSKGAPDGRGRRPECFFPSAGEGVLPSPRLSFTSGKAAAPAPFQGSPDASEPFRSLFYIKQNFRDLYSHNSSDLSIRFSRQPQPSGRRSFAGTCGNALIGVEAAALPLPGERAGPAGPAAESPRRVLPAVYRPCREYRIALRAAN